MTLGEALQDLNKAMREFRDVVLNQFGLMMCGFGKHGTSKHIGGEYHKYYVCRRCKQRYVIEGEGYYMPLNTAWLNGGPYKTVKQVPEDKR